MYGSPIAMGGFVVVATENNTVYKINSATGAIRWKRHLLAPVPTSRLACPGNISPSGITGTPAYDSVTNRVFVVTNSVNARFGAHHEIFGLNATNGRTEVNRRVAIAGQGSTAWVVPTSREGAIWAPGGPVVARDGSVYVAVGNGASTSARTTGPTR